MKLTQSFLNKYIFSDTLPLEARRINMVHIIGFAATFVSMLTRVFFEHTLVTTFILLTLCLVIAFSLYVTNRFKIFKSAIWVTLIFTCWIMFPSIFILGGMIAGMPAFFVLSIVIIFAVLQTKRAIIIMTTLQIFILTGCYIASNYLTKYAVVMTPAQRIFDSVQAIVISALYIGAVILYQKKMYLLEKKKNDAVLEELLKHDKLLRAVNETASVLLAAEEDADLGSAIQKGMEIMVRPVDVDRMYIWQNFSSKDGKVFYKCIYSWQNEQYKTGKMIDCLDENSTPWLLETLTEKTSINGPIDNLPEHVRRQFARFGITSILVIPITLNNYFWGFVSLDDCKTARYFSEEDLNILKSGSLLLVNTILRSNITINLINAREEAENASMAKSEFLSNMSHEIRTPINAITGMTVIAQNSSDPERKNYCLAKIEEASSHLLDIINDILDMSKIEANKLELASLNFNFEKMLQKVVTVTNFMIDQKQQKLAIKLDKRIPNMLVGDDQRLSQVITNLLSNAAKFTPEHEQIELNADLLEEQDDGICLLRIEVIDKGIGISEEQQARLFTSFEQADSSTSRKFGGTGLGLAISKRIVELMGGKIWVESHLGEGSKFTFTVKVKRSLEKSESRLRTKASWTNIRAMIVDNDPETQYRFKDIADRLNLSYDLTSNNDEVMQMLEEKGHYDIYFMDRLAISADNAKLCNIIQELDKEKYVIIAMSAGTNDWEQTENDLQNMNIYKTISKPLFSSTISDTINECLGLDSVFGAETDTEESQECFENYHILLAEDIEINREIVKILLEPTKISIDYAENGIEAIEMFKANPEKYDMIFMDVQMPEVDGYNATAVIRKLENSWAKLIPIVAITANVFREDVEKCLESGMNDHAGKPLNLNEVMDKLRKYLPVKEKVLHGKI